MRVKHFIGMAMGVFLLFGGTVQADESVRVDFDPLPITDTWVEGDLEVNEYHYYPIEIPTVGKLTIYAQSFFDYYRVDILNADLLSFAKQENVNGSAGSPVTVDFTFYAEPGTYYARCTGEAGREGAYRLKACFEEIETTEAEPNDDYQTAQPLQEGIKVEGIHTRNDVHDYYTFEIKEEQEIQLTVHVLDSAKTHLKLYDGDMVLLDEVYDGVAFAEEKSYVYEKSLEAGTYYVDLCNEYSDGGGGPYWIRLGDEIESQSIEVLESEIRE